MAFSVPLPVGSRALRMDKSVKTKNMTQAEAKQHYSSELFCNKCLQKRLIKEAHGFCKVCTDFLCRQCVNVHESTLLTLNHGIITGSELMERYNHAMRKEKARVRTMSQNYLDMVADGRASIEYINKDDKLKEDVEPFKARLLKEGKIRVLSDKMKCFICASVIFDDGRIGVADANNNSLKLFNKYFNCLHVFHTKKEPWDICRAIDLNTDLFVSESGIHGVHQFKVTNEIKYVFTVKVDGECYGLTNWKSGVAVSTKKEKIFSIKLLDQFGNLHRNIESGLDDILKLKSPWYLTSSNKGQNLIISDAGTGAITSIDVDGGIKFIHRDKKGLKDPRNIAADRDNNIYVVDYETDTVHQLTARGLDLGIVLCGKDGLQNPCGIACFKEYLYIQSKMDTNFMNVYDMV